METRAVERFDMLFIVAFFVFYEYICCFIGFVAARFHGLGAVAPVVISRTHQAGDFAGCERK
jgi:hypothetical protein